MLSILLLGMIAITFIVVVVFLVAVIFHWQGISSPMFSLLEAGGDRGCLPEREGPHDCA